MEASEATRPADRPAFSLPDTVSGPTDLLRLQRELASLEDYMLQAGKRLRYSDPTVSDQPPVEVKLPKTTRMFEDVFSLNGWSALRPADRQRLAEALKLLQRSAPVLHISLAVDPSAAVEAKLIGWLRCNVSPYVLVQIGRQPTIGGGCILRTSNQRFDFSLRRYMDSQRGQLVGALAKAAQP